MPQATSHASLNEMTGAPTDGTTQLFHLGSSPIAEAKRIQAALQDKGVQLVLVADPESCRSKNCQPRIEIFVRPEDATQVEEFFKVRADEFGGPFLSALSSTRA